MVDNYISGFLNYLHFAYNYKLQNIILDLKYIKKIYFIIIFIK